MKRERVISGAAGGLLLWANLLGSPAEAHAEEAICGAVYDTVDPGTSSGKLQEQVRKYAVRNIAVHALILTAPEGVANSNDLANYQEKIADQCGYAGKGYISIAVSKSPRAFNVQRNGEANKVITTSAVKAATPDFIADLQDTSTPYQDDIAGLLEAIDPSKAPVGPTQDLPRPTTPPSSTEQKPLDVPWALIGWSVLGVATVGALGALGARIARHRQLTNMYRKRSDELAEERDDSKAVIGEAEQLTSGLPGDSAPALREAIDKLKRAEADNEARIAEIAERYHREAIEIMPDEGDIDEIDRNLSDATSTISKLRQAVVAEQKKFIQRLEKVKTDNAAYNQLVSDCMTLLNTLEFGGWDVTPLKQEFTEITNEAANTIGELRVDENVEKLEAALTTHMPLVNGLHTTLKKVETDRQTTDEKIGKQPNDQTSIDNAIGLAKTQFAALETEYDASCYDDLTEQMNGLDGSRTKLDSLYAAAQKTVGQKIYATLQESVRLVKDFDAVLADITSITKKVAERTEKIAAIKDKLPNLLLTIASTLRNAHDYAFSGEFADDVEDETRQLIENAEKDFESFKKKDVSVAKPNYLELEKAAESHKQNADTLLKKAHAEKAEMDQLRSRYRQYIDEANEAYHSLEMYISSHSADLNGFDSPNVDIPTYRQGYTRKELQKVIGKLEQIQSSIEQARDDAESKVRRAEERREATRQAAIAAELAREQAERQRQQAEQQRRDDAQRTFNTGGGLGPTNTGGGFGSSNNGGSF